MKEKFMITSFFAGNMTEALFTFVGTSQGHVEKGVIMSKLFENESIVEAAMLKVGVTVVLIGLYALSKSDRWTKEHAFVVDRSVRALNIIFWGAAAIDAVRVSGGF